MGTATVSAWDEQTQTRIDWIKSSELPEGAFELSPGVVVEDITAFRHGLLADAEQGPTTPRAIYGGLQEDIARLHSTLVVHRLVGAIGRAQADQLTAVATQAAKFKGSLSQAQWDTVVQAGRSRRSESSSP